MLLSCTRESMKVNRTLMKTLFSVGWLALGVVHLAPAASLADPGTSFYRWDTNTFYISDTDDDQWTDHENLADTLFGAKLASVNDADENLWIQLNIRNTNGSPKMEEGWIGLDDESTEGTYVWQDGHSYSSGYKNWASGEPNDGGGGLSEDFVVFRWYSGGVWNDYQDGFFGALYECPASAVTDSVCDQLNDGGAPNCNVGSLLLQNATFSTGQTFKRENFIQAGNNVDGDTPTGDFTLSGGTTTMWAESYIKLDTGFSVTSGAKLTATVSDIQCN